MTDIYVSQCQGERTRFLGALARARNPSDHYPSSRSIASRLMVPALCRTRHLFAVEDSEESDRRSSLCPLPASKQTDGSLGSCLRRSARHQRGLEAYARVILMSCSCGRFRLPRRPRVPRQARSPVVCVLRQAYRRPSSRLRRASPDSCSLVAVLAHVGIVDLQPFRNLFRRPVQIRLLATIVSKVSWFAEDTP
jgi:hypothetical protein